MGIPNKWLIHTSLPYYKLRLLSSDFSTEAYLPSDGDFLLVIYPRSLLY